MFPILKDDINRANKENLEKNKSENQIVAKEFEQQMKPNNKPSSVASEIKLKSACLFATKSDINDLAFSKSVCYAFVCKEALFVSRMYLPLCLLLSLTFCRSLLTSFHKTCHRAYHLFERLSIRLTKFPVHPYPTVHHTVPIQRRQRRLCVKYRSCSTKVIYVNLLVLVLFLLH